MQIDVLKAKGLEEGDATAIINIVGQREHKKFFVDYMVCFSRPLPSRREASHYNQLGRRAVLL